MTTYRKVSLSVMKYILCIENDNFTNNKNMFLVYYTLFIFLYEQLIKNLVLVRFSVFLIIFKILKNIKIRVCSL